LIELANGQNIKIDNCQGVLKISTLSSGKLSLGDIGSAVLLIDAPNATVEANLKSLHDDSFINCASANFHVGEDFDDFYIYDHQLGKMRTEGDETHMKPTLHVNSSKGLDIKVMSDFELLKLKIMAKMGERK